MSVKITCITPSIRPDGLKVVHDTLAKQTFKDFEWLPRLSIAGPKSDLCYQMNQALKEAKGELIVFLQDYIDIGENGLLQMWLRYQEAPRTGWTAPVGKYTDENDVVQWDWRPHWEAEKEMEFHRFEIDWACISRKAYEEVGGFDEDFDRGFGWENVEWAYRLHHKGWQFRCDPDNQAIAFDHDKTFPHPYKKHPNSDLWAIKKAVIDQIELHDERV